MSGRRSINGRKSMNGGRSNPPRMHYSFPILKDTEIVECVNNMAIPLSEAELRQPNFQVLRVIFTNAVEFLMGITADELNQPKFSGLEELSYPDLHEESVPRLNLFRISSRLLETCGCRDFSLPDLFKPSYDKFRVYLSAIINFAKFREDQLDVYAQKTDLQEKMAAELKEKTTVIDGVTKKIEEINAKHEKDMPVIMELQEQKKQLKGEMKARSDEQKKSMMEKDQIKQEYTAVCDKTESIKDQIRVLESDTDTLSTQVVQSPDRLKAEISELDRRFSDESKVLADMQAQKQADSAQERIRLDTIKHIKKTLAHMETLAKQQKKYKEASKVLKGNKSKISALEAEITEQDALHDHYIHRTNTCGKKQEAIDEQSSDRTQMQTLKQQQAEHDTLFVAFEGGQGELNSVLQDIENVKKMALNDKQDHMKRMRDQFTLLQNTVEKFNNANRRIGAMLN